jgi:phosphoenolpyruvate carboxykinase (diphosphate)
LFYLSKLTIPQVIVANEVFVLTTAMKSQPNYTFPERRAVDERQIILQHICLQLASLGHRCQLSSDRGYLSVADSLLKNYSAQRQLLAEYRCPADQRIQDFLNDYLKRNGVNADIRLPGVTFNLNESGIARELSLPFDSDTYKSDLVESYRLIQGVLHNPKNDRRTTSGVFHIVEGGLPIPVDKKAVPVDVYANLLQVALDPPTEIMGLPIASAHDEPIDMWVSLLLRPIVRPEVEGALPEKSLETRMFAPGSLVSNLDFVESIFGNGGDPFLPENDAALDIDHWTGHSGCIILAPQLTRLSKKALGLPHYDDATARQRKDSMCWKDGEELYNEGEAFKIVCRDMSGVIVTVIADNYFGYSKKEIKSQISYSANLFGGVEEEHSGGAIAFPRFNLGNYYLPKVDEEMSEHTFERLCQQLKGGITVKPEGYAIDNVYTDIIYIPENAHVDMQEQMISWSRDGVKQQIKLLVQHTYIYPSGFKVHLQKHPQAPSWRLIGTLGEGTFCHKPSTVSGGGKSEISKSIQDSMISGPVFVGDFEENLDQVEAIFNYDYSKRRRDSSKNDDRNVLTSKRSLGSVIRLLTPSAETYTDEYNQWLESIPQHILALVYLIKRFYKPEWGNKWREHFSVDEVNGYPGHELKFDGRKLITSYLRVGVRSDGTWRIYKLRQDFVAATKVQTEDDITASTVVPVSYLDGKLNQRYHNPSVKIVKNCEQRLFQRPDDAIIRGLDTQTELDLSESGNFISNFEPLTSQDARELVDDAINFQKYSAPMQELIRKAADSQDNVYFVSSAHPRVVDGKPSKNVRYLQVRPDIANPRHLYLARIGARLSRGLSLDEPVHFPVNAVLQGRRNNPEDKAAGIRPLAVYNPIHYQELPELFMDLICSLTGKSPSTTGAGSEGALTKGPFNALSTAADLNNALVSFILCDYAGYSSAAGYIGAHRRVDHDISMLIPEIWCRLPIKQRDPKYLIEHGFLEKIENFEHNGKMIYASRLGYRITENFVHSFFGKVFDSPTTVFDEDMLRPETQGLEAYVDGINNIVEAQQKVARGYIEDGSINDACPPLQAILHIMAEGHFEGKTIDDPTIRHMFTREYLLESDWYKRRLKIKQQRDAALWQMNRDYIEQKMDEINESVTDLWADLQGRMENAEHMLEWVNSESYLERLVGTIGADWIHIDD